MACIYPKKCVCLRQSEVVNLTMWQKPVLSLAWKFISKTSYRIKMFFCFYWKLSKTGLRHFGTATTIYRFLMMHSSELISKCGKIWKFDKSTDHLNITDLILILYVPIGVISLVGRQNSKKITNIFPIICKGELSFF